MLFHRVVYLTMLSALFGSPAAFRAHLSFRTDAANNQMATATRPDTASKFDIESADDFLLSSPTRI